MLEIPNSFNLKGSVLDGKPSLTCIKENEGGETTELLEWCLSCMRSMFCGTHGLIECSSCQNNAGNVLYAYYGVHYIDVVIQQENVLTELYSYVNQIPPPADAPSVKCTLKYLTACSQLFEQGFLSHKRVSIKEREVLVNIEKGFCFFSEWLQSIIDEGNLA